LTDAISDSVTEKIKGGTDSEGNLNNPISPRGVGIPRSCQIYEPDLVDQILQEASDKFTKAYEEVQSCISDYKINNPDSSNDDALNSCGASEKIGDFYKDNIANSLKKSDEAQTCFSDEVANGTDPVKAREKCNLDDILGKENAKNLEDMSRQNNEINECIAGKFEEANNDKGTYESGGRADWIMYKCGVPEEQRGAMKGGIEEGLDNIRDTYQRGDVNNCEWVQWPWAEGSCVREGVAEGVFWAGEGLGHAAGFVTAPLNGVISAGMATWDGLTTGNWNEWGDNFSNNFQSGYTQIQNGFSSGARAVAHGVGGLAGTVVNLYANIQNGYVSAYQTAGQCLFQGDCDLNNFGENYNNNSQWLKDNMAWDTGDFAQNALIVGGTAAIIAATIFTGGLAGGFAVGALGLTGAAATIVGGAVTIGAGYLVGTTLGYGLTNGISYIDHLQNPEYDQEGNQIPFEGVGVGEYICGGEGKTALECASYQAGAIVTGAAIGYGAGKALGKLPGVKQVGNLLKGIGEKGYGLGLNLGKGIRARIPGLNNQVTTDPKTGKTSTEPCLIASLDKDPTVGDYLWAFVGGVRVSACEHGDLLDGEFTTDSVVKGYTKHGVDQANSRGFSSKAINRITSEGSATQATGRYGPQTRYTLGGNTVVLNSNGYIVTVFSSAPQTNTLPRGYFIPFTN